MLACGLGGVTFCLSLLVPAGKSAKELLNTAKMLVLQKLQGEPEAHSVENEKLSGKLSTWAHVSQVQTTECVCVHLCVCMCTCVCVCICVARHACPFTVSLTPP